MQNKGFNEIYYTDVGLPFMMGVNERNKPDNFVDTIYGMTSLQELSNFVKANYSQDGEMRNSEDKQSYSYLYKANDVSVIISSNINDHMIFKITFMFGCYNHNYTKDIRNKFIKVISSNDDRWKSPSNNLIYEIGNMESLCIIDIE